MSQSTNLRLPYLAANQAQKHVTVNEAFRFLDALVQLSIKSAALSAPPGSPADGYRYIVAAAPTGAWAGHATHVAAWQDGAWAFYAPGEGWVAWNEATSAPLVYKAGAWVSLLGGTFASGSITELGIGAATDATNKFVFFGTNMLFNTGGSIDATFNKAAAGNDASFSFKTGFSARALLGLLGSDDFTIKVSANGSTFFTGLVVDRSSGRVSLPQGVALGGLAADPGSPQNGWLWHNSTTGQLKARLDGITRILAPDEIPFVAPGAGDYVLTTIGAGAATGTLAGVADRVDLFPFVPRADLSIDRLSVNVTTAVASALGKVVLYASNAAGQPAGLLTETGTLDFSTTGVKEATVALTFRKGVTYWLGIRHNSTATLSAWVANATPDLTVNAPTTQQRKVLRRTVTFATAAPDPWTYVSSETANAVATAIWLRAACPACLRDDIAAHEGPPTAAMAMRGDWQMREAFVCVRHHHPLVELWKVDKPADRHDIAARLREIGGEIRSGGRDRPALPPSAYDLWLDARLQDGRDETWLKDQSLFAVTTFCRLLGHALRPTDLREADCAGGADHAAGFDIARNGETAIRAALERIAASATGHLDAPNKIFGPMYVGLNRDYVREPGSPYSAVSYATASLITGPSRPGKC